jgi:hypothetical protein
MEIVISKKANKIISTFTQRETDVFNTGIGYIKEDMKHIIECEREIKVYSNPNPAKYTTAIKHQTNMTFRAKYLLQCLGLYVYDNFEGNKIEVDC